MTRPFHDVPPFVQAAPPPAERRLALVVGNGRYSAERDVLTNPPNDATGMAAALTRVGFYGVKQDGDDYTVDFAQPGVPALLDLDQRHLGRALAAMARAADGVRQAVIYYAGHGIEVGGENYLIPIDAKLAHIRDAEFETQPLSRALRTIEGATGLRLVILDACRNNPFRARLFGARDMAGGLRGIEPPSNVLVAYAAKHGTFASDGKKGANSPFAAALLAHVETPGLEVLDLFREVKDDVLAATDNAQEPYLYGSLGKRREYFVVPKPVEPSKPEPVPPPPSGPVDDRTVELAYWQSVQTSTDPAEFIAFLEKFPTGTFAALAFERAKTLIDATQEPNVLRRLLGRYPESKLAPRLRRRLAAMQWPQLRKSKDVAALEVFAAEVHDQPEAEMALTLAELPSRSAGSGRRWGLIGVCSVGAFAVAGLGLWWIAPTGMQVGGTQSANSQPTAVADAYSLKSLPVAPKLEPKLALTLTPHRGPVVALGLLAGGRRLVSIGADAQARITDLDSGALARTIALVTTPVQAPVAPGPSTATPVVPPPNLSPPISAAVQGAMLVTAHSDGTIAVWDLDKGERVASTRRLDGTVAAVTFAGDPDKVAVAGGDGKLMLLDRKSGATTPATTSDGHREAITAMVYVGERNGLLTASADKSIRSWNAESLSRRRTYTGHKDAVTALDVAPDGRSFVSGAEDGQLRLWSTLSSAVRAQLLAHDIRITAIAHAPNGDTLATGAADATVKLWDLKSGKELAAFRLQAGAVRALLFAADGRRLLMGHEDGSVNAWDIAGARLAPGE